MVFAPTVGILTMAFIILRKLGRSSSTMALASSCPRPPINSCGMRTAKLKPLCSSNIFRHVVAAPAAKVEPLPDQELAVPPNLTERGGRTHVSLSIGPWQMVIYSGPSKPLVAEDSNGWYWMRIRLPWDSVSKCSSWRRKSYSSWTSNSNRAMPCWVSHRLMPPKNRQRDTIKAAFCFRELLLANLAGHRVAV